MRRLLVFATRLASREMLRCGICARPPDGSEFCGRHIQAKAPTGNVWAFIRHHRIKRRVGCGQRTAQSIQLARCGDLVKLKQVTEPPDYSADPQAKGALNQSTRIHVRALHP